MTIEVIGYIVFLLGAIGIVLGARFAIAVLCLSVLFGAAAAIQLPSLGGSSIQPSHLLLFSLIACCMLRPRLIQQALASAAYPGPGFWFAGYILFSVLSAFFLPRIFQGATLVYSSARGASGVMSTIASPLSPGSSNLTQAVYLLSDLACFAVVCGLAQLGHARFLAQTLVMTAVTCFALASLDVGTFMAGHPEWLDFIRNANYTMHTAETMSGFKRIVGSYPEASAYGSAALAYFTFTLMLWLERFPSRLAGFAALSIGVTILLCTSTTAYIAGALVLSAVIAFSLSQLVAGRTTTRHAAFLSVTLFVVPAAVIGLMLIPDAWNAVNDLASLTLVDKLESQSGEERTAWNTLALTAFVETATFGGGLGTVRASSFPAALLSNIGVAGTVLFFVFLHSLLNAARSKKLPERPDRTIEDRTIGLAAIFASMAQIASATVSASGIDLGLLFSTTAGLAAGCLTRPGAARERFAQPHLSRTSASLTTLPVLVSR